MIRINELRLPYSHSREELERAIRSELGLAPGAETRWRIVRKSVDARNKKDIQFVYSIDVELTGESGGETPARSAEERLLARGLPNIIRAPQNPYCMPPCAPSGSFVRPVVVGAGPCGLFAALLLAQTGWRPLLLERGKPARERAKDVQEFWRTGALNPRSNALFGEGGAGTFSDGKLTTRIKDREGRCRKVLEELARAGAPEEILWLAKPHVGTDKLVKVVENIRSQIVQFGGEVRFETLVTAFQVENGRLRGLVLEGGEEIEASAVALAIGHSARDTFESLHAAGVAMSPKAFSIGARIEHPQTLVDAAQYGPSAGDERLGAAEYQLVHKCKSGRVVYSFCMCPGGAVIATATEPGGVVTNGMSAHARKARNANSALLVGVDPRDFAKVVGPKAKLPEALRGVEFQRLWESAAWKAGGGGFLAPAQRVEDLLRGRPSTKWGDVEPSYAPGCVPTDLADCLPDYVVASLREALPLFERKLRGFAMADAVLTGVETRSSSPVRIDRDENCVGVNTSGLYPAGEGAGYAGGILSAAVDGLRVAEQIARTLSET